MNPRPLPPAWRALKAHPPFDRMPDDELRGLLDGAQPQQLAPDEVLLAPDHGPADALWLVLRGRVVGRRPLADGAEEVFQLLPGDVFPVAAWTAARAVTATYRALGDVSVVRLAGEAVRQTQARSVVWADHLQLRARAYLQRSQQRLQADIAASLRDGHALDQPLGQLPRRTPVGLPASAAVREALLALHERQIGSVLVWGPAGEAIGILTRHDVLGRIALPGLPLDTPLAQVMSQPLRSLDVAATGHDAALLMAQHNLRHVPVLEGGRVVHVVSERDLFAMQRLTARHLGSALDSAQTLPEFVHLAGETRRYARQLMAQGVQARALTGLVSQLNDRLTRRLIEVHRQAAGLPADGFCWVALGSEGRHEQTLATDQDNALIFDSPAPARDRPRWMAFARAVNQALDQCGYPLCQGGIMAGQPECCLSRDEWASRFGHWMASGGPQELLHAAIFFDLRALAGRHEWVDTLREQVLARTRALPRFIRQMVHSHAEHGVPLNWRGGIDGEKDGPHRWLDLKLQGTALVVEAARIAALAHGVAATNTRERLAAAGPLMGAPAAEYEGWISAFDVLQMQRMALQAQDTVDHAHPNRIDLRRLNAVDERVLQTALRAVRGLQQRLVLDYLR